MIQISSLGVFKAAAHTIRERKILIRVRKCDEHRQLNMRDAYIRRSLPSESRNSFRTYNNCWASSLITKFATGIHGELPHTAFEICSPEDVEYAIRGSQEDGKMLGLEGASDVVASFWNERRIVIKTWSMSLVGPRDLDRPVL